MAKKDKYPKTLWVRTGGGFPAAYETPEAAADARKGKVEVGVYQFVGIFDIETSVEVKSSLAVETEWGSRRIRRRPKKRKARRAK